MPGRSAVRGALLRTWPRRHIPLCPCQPSCFQLLVGDTTNECGFPQSTRSLFHVGTSGLPDDFADGGGTTVPLSGGARWFVALRCYAEECAISLSTQAQHHVWDLAEYKRVKPAHCPTGAMSGGTGCERNLLWAYHLLCLRTRLVLCMTGVLDLDLT